MRGQGRRDPDAILACQFANLALNEAIVQREQLQTNEARLAETGRREMRKPPVSGPRRVDGRCDHGQDGVTVAGEPLPAQHQRRTPQPTVRLAAEIS